MSEWRIIHQPRGFRSTLNKIKVLYNQRKVPIPRSLVPIFKKAIIVHRQISVSNGSYWFDWDRENLCMFGEFISNPIAQGVGGTFFPDTCAQSCPKHPEGLQTPPLPPQPSLRSMILSVWRQKSKYRHQNSNIWCQKVKILC